MSWADLSAISCRAPDVTRFIERSGVGVGWEFGERFVLIVFSIGIAPDNVENLERNFLASRTCYSGSFLQSILCGIIFIFGALTGFFARSERGRFGVPGQLQRVTHRN
jgi:hypothetical protein